MLYNNTLDRAPEKTECLAWLVTPYSPYAWWHSVVWWHARYQDNIPPDNGQYHRTISPLEQYPPGQYPPSTVPLR